MPKVSNIFSSSLEAMDNPYAPAPQSRLIDQIQARAKARIAEAGERQIHQRDAMHPRDAMIVTTTHWEHQGKFITLWANPSDMQWSLPRRGTAVKTMGGTVRNVWRNRYKGTYYDEGTVNITFQSGNIMPGAAYTNAEIRDVDTAINARNNPRPPHGLQNFYDFLALLDDPMLLGAGENFHHIFCRTRVFPDLHLEGYFQEDTLTMGERSSEGNSITWSATFQIYKSTPKLWSSVGLTAAYEDVHKQNAEETIGAQWIKNIEDKQMSDAFAAGIPAIKPKTITSSPTNNKIISDAAKNLKVQTGQTDANAGPILKDPMLREVMGQNG